MADQNGTVEDFLDKIDWEGGVDAALDYGLTTKGYDLPEDMKAGWDRLFKMWWQDYKPVADQWFERFGRDE